MNYIFGDLKRYHIDARDFFPDLNFVPLVPEQIEQSDETTLKRCLNSDKEVLYVGQVRNGKRNGFGSEYYQKSRCGNGVKVKAFFFEDQIDGEPVHIYNSKSELVFVGIYDANKPVSGVLYTDDGWPLFVGGLKDYKPHGHCLFFDENKCLECQGNFTAGQIDDDHFKIYYKSGYIKFEGYAKLDDKYGKGKLYHDGLFGTRLCFEDMDVIHMVNDITGLQKYNRQQKNTLIAEFHLENYLAYGSNVTFMSMRRKGINQAPFKSMVVDIDQGKFSGNIKVNDQNEKTIFKGNIRQDNGLNGTLYPSNNFEKVVEIQECHSVKSIPILKGDIYLYSAPKISLTTETIDGFIEYKIKKELSYLEIYDSYLDLIFSGTAGELKEFEFHNGKGFYVAGDWTKDLNISGLIRIKKEHTLRVMGKAVDLDRDKILKLENSNLEDLAEEIHGPGCLYHSNGKLSFRGKLFRGDKSIFSFGMTCGVNGVIEYFNKGFHY